MGHVSAEHQQAKSGLLEHRRSAVQTSVRKTEHPLLQLQREAGNNAVYRLLQAKLRVGQPGDQAELEADRTAARIEAGISRLPGRGRPLDNQTRIQMESGFGCDFSRVRVHQDQWAAASTKALGARAYTVGHDVVFGAGEYSPESGGGRRLLAHELTHVVQQTQTGKAIQRYTEYDSAAQAAGTAQGWQDPAYDPLMVADDGTMAVKNLNHGTSNMAWTTPAKIASSEGILKAQNSTVKLSEGATTVSGKAPQRGGAGPAITLKEVKVENRVGGGNATLTADCGTTARQVMGIPGGADKFVAVTKRNGVESYTQGQLYHGNPYTTPDRWSEEIFKKEFGAGLSRAEALKKYDDLTPAQKDQFDRKYGINKYAKPNVGQGITIGTESDMPGWTPTSPNDWNFHFAGVILSGGQDYVTLENYPGPGRTAASWFFWMYGPYTKGQSFHDIHGAYGHGNKYTTMVHQPEKLLEGKTNTEGVHLVGNPNQSDASLIVKLPKDTEVNAMQKGAQWRYVEVTSGAHAGKKGWIMNRYFEVR